VGWQRPQRVNPAPPQKDWFARARARSARIGLAKNVRALKLVDAPLRPDDEERVHRLFERVDGAGADRDE
jgi:hypothetical protein